ncbi:MAC/Perforin domain-containing protein [Cytidiella melzeri]|nr:MAC/Perforin domain-containing protein [Cytidiella melzeri]
MRRLEQTTWYKTIHSLQHCTTDLTISMAENFPLPVRPKLQEIGQPPPPRLLSLEESFNTHVQLAAAASDTATTTELTSDTPTDYIPGLLTLGSTYNVLNGKYADSKSCLQQVIDWNKDTVRVQAFGGKSYSIPDIVNYNINATSDYRSTYGKTLTDYTKSLSVKAGFDASYKGFSASASADYSESQRENISHVFTRISFNVTHYDLSLPPVRHVRKYLKSWFVDDLKDMDPIELFKEYGTHFLRSLTIGGRALFLYSTDTRTYNSDFSVEAAAKISASYLVASGGIELSASQKKAMQSFNESSECTVVTKGGDPRYGNEEFLKNVENWAGSVVDYPAFVEFGSLPCFTGIWELSDDKDRRETLQKAYANYVKLYAQELELPGPYVEARLNTNYDDKKDAYMTVTLEPNATTIYNIFLRYPPDRTDSWYIISLGAGGEAKSVLAKELVPGALAPVKWQEVLLVDVTHPTIKATRFWKAIPPTSDYIALGCIGMSGTSASAIPAQPPTSLAGRFRAVHKRALTTALYGAQGFVYYGTGGPNRLFYAVDYRYWFVGKELPLKSDCYILDNKMAVKDWTGYG